MTNPNVGMLVATTLRKRDGQVSDNVSNSNALLTRLKKQGNLKLQDGGRSIIQPLEYAENSTFQRYSGFEVLNVQESDVIDAAEYDPVQAAVNVVITGREERQNRGTAAAIRLANAKIKNAERTMANNISKDVYSDGALPNQIGGLQILVADDPTTNTTVGGINQADFDFWRNQVYDFTDNGKTSAANMLEGMNSLWINCIRGNDKPDLVVADSDYWMKYESVLQQQQRYADANLGEAGFMALKYKSADVVYDGDSGMASSHMYFLNTDYLFLVAYEGANMDSLPEKASFNQDATVVPLVFMGNLTCSNRSLQGVLKE